MADLHDLRHNRRKAGSVKADIKIPVKGCLMISGIQKYTCQNGPDIHNILSKQRKTEHEKHCRNRMAAHFHFKEINHRQTDQRDDSCIDHGCSDPAYGKVIRDQKIGFYDNADEPLKDIRKRLDHKADHNKIQWEQG